MADEPTENSEHDAKVSRRKFLKTAAAGAAAAGVVAAAPTLLGGGSVPWAGAFQGLPAGAGTQPIVAYVSDAASGEIVLLSGTDEVRVKDLGIVSWLVRAVAGA